MKKGLYPEKIELKKYDLDVRSTSRTRNEDQVSGHLQGVC
jgi:hypothetical protein